MSVEKKQVLNTLPRFIFEFQLWRVGMGSDQVGKKSKFIISSAGPDVEEAAKRAWDDAIGKFAAHLWLEDGIIWDIGIFCQPLAQDDLAQEDKKNLQQTEDGKTILLRKKLTYQALKDYKETTV